MMTYACRYVHLCVAITLIVNVFFNYLSTVLTPPGKTPEDYVSASF
jgi:hypothetical protein